MSEEFHYVFDYNSKKVKTAYVYKIWPTQILKGYNYTDIEIHSQYKGENKL